MLTTGQTFTKSTSSSQSITNIFSDPLFPRCTQRIRCCPHPHSPSDRNGLQSEPTTSAFISFFAEENFEKLEFSSFSSALREEEGVHRARSSLDGLPCVVIIYV